jgi:hypothetical protein
MVLPLFILGRPDDLRQIFEIDLVADAGAGRHHAEIVERGLAPAQEGIALAIALELDLDVLLERFRRAEIIDHHRMVDDQIDRRQRVDLFGIAAEIDHRLAHRREIDHGRHAGEILHQHARRAERDLAVGGLVLEPGADRLDVVDRDGAAVFQPQQVFQQHLQRERQARRRLGGGFEAEIIVALAVDGEGAAGRGCRYLTLNNRSFGRACRTFRRSSEACGGYDLSRTRRGDDRDRIGVMDRVAVEPHRDAEAIVAGRRLEHLR